MVGAAAASAQRHIKVSVTASKQLSLSPAGRQPPEAIDGQARIRLQQWLDRELRALLLQDDVSLVRAVVMGLVESYGLPILHPAGTASVSIRASLGPFLQENLDHFWHELR
jgi:hypothetical protein